MTDIKTNEIYSDKMLANKNEDINITVFTLHKISEEEKICEQSEAMEHFNINEIDAIRKGYNDVLKDGELNTQHQIDKLNELPKPGRDRHFGFCLHINYTYILGLL